MVHTQRIIEWLRQLVHIPSVGPENAGPRAGPGGEAAIAAAVATWFTHLGGEVVQDEVAPGRPNVYGLWRTGSARWVMVDVHTDTVGVETMRGNPFDGRHAQGKVYGRGAVDTKATLAIVLALLEAAHHAGTPLQANVVVCATIGEETGAGGARRCAQWIREQGLPIDQLLVAEPTGCAPIYGHKGGARLELEVHGVAAHSSQPALGQNAISAMAHLILALDQEHARVNSLPPPSEMGHPQMSVTLITGGQARNVIPDRCRIQLSRRLVVGETPEAVAAHLEAFATQHCPLPVTLHYHGGVQAFYQSPETPWIQQLAAWSGVRPATAPYGTNMGAYVGLARDAVVFGPGDIAQAHGEVEWVAVAELAKAARVYEQWWGLA